MPECALDHLNMLEFCFILPGVDIFQSLTTSCILQWQEAVLLLMISLRKFHDVLWLFPAA
jgi:hypothetical protein